MYNFAMNLMHNLKKLTILYAEDDPVARASIGEALSFFANKVIVVSNGKEALESFYRRLPNIVILDIEMPVLNGLDVAKEIRGKDAITPIVIITNHMQTDKLLEAVKLNLVDYIPKPLNFEKLKGALEECVLRMERNGAIKYQLGEDTTYSFSEKTLYKRGLKEELTQYDFRLLELFIKHRGAIVTYDMIYDLMDDIISKDSLKNAVYRLKKKVGNGVIINIKDVGYCIR